MALILVPKEQTNAFRAVTIDGNGDLLVNGVPLGNKIVQIADAQETDDMLDEIFGDL